MPLLSLDGLTLRYGEIEALHSLSLSVEAGEVVTLLGANGAGKSTTLRAISGLLQPVSGAVVFDGKSIAGLAPEVIVKLGIAHVPEGRRIFPGLSARENIMLGGSNRGRIATSVLRSESDDMFDLFPEKTIEHMQAVKTPWIAFKVLAGGAILPPDGFKFAFENGADFICVGMFDFQIVQNVNIAFDVLANVKNRPRPWCA